MVQARFVIDLLDRGNYASPTFNLKESRSQDVRIAKKYFSIEEVMERWHMPERDLGYLAENDELRLSVRVYGLHVEFGRFEWREDRSVVWQASRTTRHSGLLDLHAGDAFMIFRFAERNLIDFRTPKGDLVRIADGHEPLLVMLGDLLVRREERDRFEKLRGFTGAGLCSGQPGFSASEDFRHICCNGTHFRLGAVQARVVRLLAEASENGAPWQNGKKILTQARSRSLRMADVFKSQPKWRELIESNGRGHYRLHKDSEGDEQAAAAG